MNLPLNSPLGKLKIIEVYHYYDGPKLFSCRSNSGQIYYAFWLGDDNESDNWMYVPVSRNRYIAARSGSISLYDVCKNSEDEFVWMVEIPFDTSKITLVQLRLCEELSDDLLPSIDSHLSLDINTLPPLEELAPVKKEKAIAE